MIRTICGRGHELRGPQDRLTDGKCRHCHRENQRKLALKQRDGLAIVNAAAERRLTPREVIDFLAQAPAEMVRHWQALDPYSMDKLRESLAELAGAET